MSDVNFYDYDGTIVDSYTASEFASLSAMPSNPTHEGLTAQGWNWSLTDAKAYVNKYGKLNVGQMYITSDGKTRLYITLHDGRLSPTLGLAVNGSVDVDWGDGTAHSTMTGSSTTTAVYAPHTYAEEGDYAIAITPSSGSTFAFVGNTNNSTILTSMDSPSYATRQYLGALVKCELGESVIIGARAFNQCLFLRNVVCHNNITLSSSSAFYGSGLTFLVVPNNITSFGAYTCQACSYMRGIVLPDSTVSIGNEALRSSKIWSVIIPDGVTSIPSLLFYDCYFLQSLIVPDGVVSLGSGVFTFSNSLSFIKFTSTTPPIATATSTFGSVPTDCIIYVPEGYLEDYEDATNYPDPDVYQYVEY